MFKPYLLVQTSANFNWYDDEGLDKAYNQDNVANSGFAIPYAVLGFTGKAVWKSVVQLITECSRYGSGIVATGLVRCGAEKTVFYPRG